MWDAEDANGSTSSGSAKLALTRLESARINVPGGAIFDVGGACKGECAGGYNVQVNFYQSGGGNVGGTAIAVPPGASWTSFSGRLTAPSSTANVSVILSGRSSSNPSWFDDISLSIVSAPAPTATFTALPATIDSGQAAALTWTTSGAASVAIDNGIGSRPLSGSLSVSPIVSTTYTLTASGIGGTTTKQVSVTVTPPKPQISFTASLRTIAEGERSTLAWNVLNATTISIDHGIGNRPASGSTSVSPAETTTYKLTATGPGGTSSAQVTVTVLNAPVISFSATPSAITRGGASTLTWTVMEATLVVIDNGIGAQLPSGALVVRPTETTTYLLTASGPGGVRLGQATITVNAVGRRRSVRH